LNELEGIEDPLSLRFGEASEDEDDAVGLSRKQI
jgi:hypothetical protein